MMSKQHTKCVYTFRHTRTHAHTHSSGSCRKISNINKNICVSTQSWVTVAVSNILSFCRWQWNTHTHTNTHYCCHWAITQLSGGLFHLSPYQYQNCFTFISIRTLLLAVFSDHLFFHHWFLFTFRIICLKLECEKPIDRMNHTNRVR